MLNFKNVLNLIWFISLPFSVYLQEESAAPQWSYRDALFWGNRFPGCNLLRQSPLHLQTLETSILPLPPLQFANYDVPLSAPITLRNKGQTIEFDVPPTTNGVRPLIRGGILNGVYEAVGVHFHWGSRGLKGSEHVIDNCRYDGEIHMVHKNIRYRTVREAAQFADGLAAFAVMLEISNVYNNYPGLAQVFNSLPSVVNYRSSVNLTNPLTLADILGDVDIRNFFLYKGSMTTPNCSEAVTWHVFPQPLLVSLEQMQNFWAISDNQGFPLINNFRPLQERNGRSVLYVVQQYY